MPRHLRTTVLVCGSALALLSARALSAQQAVQTDARWYAWLGCWASDSTRAAAPNVVCIVPVKGSRAVDALTIARGKVTTRDRLDAGRSHAIDGQGCRGTEAVNWSAAGRRVFLHADYTCAGGIPGASSTIFALSPEGDWLRTERVRSGSGAVVTIDRLHPTELPAVLSPDVARSIDGQQRAITTARAAAAVSISTDEIIDAVRALDADVVRSWLVASEQQFDLNGQQVAALANAGVPASVIQIVSAENGRYEQAPLPLPRNTDAYATDPSYAQQQTYPQMTTMRRCPPDGCYPSNQYSTYNGYSYQPLGSYPYGYGYSPYYYYPAPVIVRRGVNQGINHGSNRGGYPGVNRGGNPGVNRGGNRGGQPHYQTPARPSEPRKTGPVGRKR